MLIWLVIFVADVPLLDFGFTLTVSPELSLNDVQMFAAFYPSGVTNSDSGVVPSSVAVVVELCTILNLKLIACFKFAHRCHRADKTFHQCLHTRAGCKMLQALPCNLDLFASSTPDMRIHYKQWTEGLVFPSFGCL